MSLGSSPGEERGGGGGCFVCSVKVDAEGELVLCALYSGQKVRSPIPGSFFVACSAVGKPVHVFRGDGRMR